MPNPNDKYHNPLSRGLEKMFNADNSPDLVAEIRELGILCARRPQMGSIIRPHKELNRVFQLNKEC